MLVALGIESGGRSPAVGQPLREFADLQLYLGRRFYKPQQDIHIVECFCTADIRRQFLVSKMTTSLGNQVTRWKSNAPTKGLRVPAVLTLGGWCKAFATPRHEALKNDIEAERFLWAYRDAAIRLRQDPDVEPEPIVEECPRDSTLDILVEDPDTRSEADTVGVLQFNSRHLDCSFFPKREPL